MHEFVTVKEDPLIIRFCLIALTGFTLTGPANTAYADLMPLAADGDSTGGAFDTTNTQLRAGFSSPSTERRFALEFDVSSIPSASVIDDATLGLTFENESLGGDYESITYTLFGYYGPTAGSTADGTLTAGDYSSSAVAIDTFSPAGRSPGSRVTFDVTSFISGRNMDDDFVGFRFAPNGTQPPGTGSTLVFFSSQEATGTANDPTLDVNASAVPEPSSLALCGAVAGGLLLRRRFRSRRVRTLCAV